MSVFRGRCSHLGMSALGQKQTSRPFRAMSVIPLKADIHTRGLQVG